MGFKKLIKSSFIGRYLISELHCLESVILPKLISDEKAVRKYYRKCTGKELNLENPQTFCEKLNWYKLYGREPLMVQCADKVAVRDYVREKGFGDCLNEFYGIYDDVCEIDLNQLPERFVLKAAHGSHMNIIVKDNKDQINWRQQKMMMRSWLKQNIYWSGREWVYKDIPRKIIAEKYLEDEYGGLRDYKFYCFNGNPTYIDVDVDRNIDHYRNFYDMEWKFIPMSSCVPNRPDAIVQKPVRLEEMKSIAKVLSEPFQFVRVDLYEVKGNIYFGELTFFQDGGNPGYSEEYDLEIGKHWNLTR